MSDNGNFGFAKLVPGFDFLQNLTKGAAQGMPQMTQLSSWVAPTLNVEELEKRIGELKAVHFWLDQNGKALAATIQALEVQKMTLATLQGMNMKMGDLASALQAKSPGAAGKSRSSAADTAAAPAGGKAKANGPAAGAVDPMQWWGALSQQFQEIASNAMKDVAQHTSAPAGPKAAAPAAAPSAARKGPARKSTPRKGRTAT